MANYPYTGSQLVSATGKNVTRVSLSTNILISVDGLRVGAIKSLSVNESGDVAQITEVGTDAVIDSCRTKAVNISGQCQRTRMYKVRLAEAFGMPFMHLHAQIYPFDITIIDRSSPNPAEQIVTVIKNVIFDKISYGYQNDNYLIIDDCSWKAEGISSTLGGRAGVSAVTGGTLGIKPIYQVPLNDGTTGGMGIERAADTGFNARRGALDISGIATLGD
jgi:hypothetical protein